MPDARHLLAARLRHPPGHPPIAADHTLILSIKPRYADLIASGQKRIEFRRRFPAAVTRARALLYVSSPVQAIQLTCTISEVHRASARKLWHDFAEHAGVTPDDFDAYFDGAPAGVALLLTDVQRLSPPLPLGGPVLRAIDFRPPQSLALLPPHSPLGGFCLPAPRAAHNLSARRRA
jgi:predicted transcriptional regulator